MKSTKIQSGLNIYDYSNILLGGFDNLVRGLISLNDFDLNTDLNSLATQAINYDDSYYVDQSPQVQLTPKDKPSVFYSINAVNGQGIYDLNLQGYSGFDNVVKFLVDNNINSINDQSVAGRTLTFNRNANLDFSLKSVIEKRKYVFGTVFIENGYLMTEDDKYLQTENGEFIEL